MKLENVYVMIQPTPNMNKCEDMIVKMNTKNISDFTYDSGEIIDFYSDFNSAYSDAFDIWEEVASPWESIISEVSDD